MEVVNYLGDILTLRKKGFVVSDKDPFSESSLQKGIGKGLFILVNEKNEVRMEINGLIFPGVDYIKPSFDKMGLKYEIVEI